MSDILSMWEKDALSGSGLVFGTFFSKQLQLNGIFLATCDRYFLRAMQFAKRLPAIGLSNSFQFWGSPL